jgi:hypothetical protein
MLYQLPNGRVVYLTIEEYLDLTPEDIQYLISTGLGAQPLNPFFGSSMNNKSSSILDDDINDDIDFNPEDDEDLSEPTSLNDI